MGLMKSKSIRPATLADRGMMFEGFSISVLPEPDLLFGYEKTDTDPKRGLTLYGPYDLETATHRDRVRVGIVGTDDTIAQTEAWLNECAKPIPGVSGKLRQMPHFPGFRPDISFHSQFVTQRRWQQRLTMHDLQAILGADRITGFERAVDCFAKKVQLIAELDDKPDVIICALPQDVVDAFYSIRPDGIQPSRRSTLERLLEQARKSGQMVFRELFEPSETSTAKSVYRSFRRALKARVMRWDVPIQIVQPRLFEGGLKSQDKATRAWNFCVGMYFKAKGIPWKLAAIEAGTCYVGVSFYHQVTETSHAVYSSLAQVFTDQGEGIVLRGEKFEWDSDKKGRSPHLSEAHACDLIRRAIEKYREYYGTLPRRVVVHKTSQYWAEELRGFQSGLSDISDYDLVAIDQSGVRFFREGQYPPLRGTLCDFHSKGYFLYTMGYICFLETYPRGHVPEPLQIVQHIGSSSIQRICQEILGLTKMNWNSAEYAGLLPITLRFAKRVGEIMSELPENEVPKPSYRFYM